MSGVGQAVRLGTIQLRQQGIAFRRSIARISLPPDEQCAPAIGCHRPAIVIETRGKGTCAQFRRRRIAFRRCKFFHVALTRSRSQRGVSVQPSARSRSRPPRSESEDSSQPAPLSTLFPGQSRGETRASRRTREGSAPSISRANQQPLPWATRSKRSTCCAVSNPSSQCSDHSGDGSGKPENRETDLPHPGKSGAMAKRVLPSDAITYSTETLPQADRAGR